MMSGKLADAASQVQRGLDLETNAVGSEDEGLAGGLSLFAEIRLAQGQAADAERLARRAASVATAPEAKLQHQVAAMMWHAHAECDASGGSAEIEAALAAAKQDTSAGTLQVLQGAVDGLAAAIADYPSCAADPSK